MEESLCVLFMNEKNTFKVKLPIQNNSQGLGSDIFFVIRNASYYVQNLWKENNAIFNSVEVKVILFIFLSV